MTTKNPMTLASEMSGYATIAPSRIDEFAREWWRAAKSHMRQAGVSQDAADPLDWRGLLDTLRDELRMYPITHEAQGFTRNLADKRAWVKACLRAMAADLKGL